MLRHITLLPDLLFAADEHPGDASVAPAMRGQQVCVQRLDHGLLMSGGAVAYWTRAALRVAGREARLSASGG